MRGFEPPTSYTPCKCASQAALHPEKAVENEFPTRYSSKTTIIAKENMMLDIDPTWQEVLKEECKKPYFLALSAFVAQERRLSPPVYPDKELVFNAFKKTAYDKVKVVILGQDPYHRPGQAHGLAFSVPSAVALPPSLQNIYKELERDTGKKPVLGGCLEGWARQGVFLLNTTLTVKEGAPLSHFGRGWEVFTRAVLEKLATRTRPIIFVLWGKSAQDTGRFLGSFPLHKVLTAPHPSPLSAHRGFFGCSHFSKINQILASLNESSIAWEDS